MVQDIFLRTKFSNYPPPKVRKSGYLNDNESCGDTPGFLGDVIVSPSTVFCKHKTQKSSSLHPGALMRVRSKLQKSLIRTPHSKQNLSDGIGFLLTPILKKQKNKDTIHPHFINV